MNDYYLDPTERYPRELTKCPGMNPVMRILGQVFDPTNTRVSAFRDCVLISLDTEYNSHARTNRLSQIGLAILDTRDIKRADDAELSKDVLSSRLLLLTREQNTKKGVYLFGEPEECHGGDLINVLLSILRVVDSKNTTQFRNIILIGHGIKWDIEEIALSSGLDILALPMIKAIIDTSTLLNSVYNTPYRFCSLRETCKFLGMYRRNMHTAGNDAMYTLKALLLIFYHYKVEEQSWTDGPADRALLYQCHLEAIKSIGRCNNGIGRAATARLRKRRTNGGVDPSYGQRDRKVPYQDVLMEDDERVMDSLFIV